MGIFRDTNVFICPESKSNTSINTSKIENSLDSICSAIGKPRREVTIPMDEYEYLQKQEQCAKLFRGLFSTLSSNERFVEMLNGKKISQIGLDKDSIKFVEKFSFEDAICGKTIIVNADIQLQTIE